jgi:hypothetical protein
VREGAREQGRGGVSGTSAPAAAWILWPIVTLQVVLTVSGVLLAALARSASSTLSLGFALDTVGVAITVLAFPAVGALIFWRRPEHPIGWLFCAANLGWAISNFVGPYAMYALVANPGSLPAGKLAAWFHTWPQYISLGLLVLLLLLFPDGTLLSPRWRLVVWLVVGMAAAGAVRNSYAPVQCALMLPLFSVTSSVKQPGKFMNTRRYWRDFKFCWTNSYRAS